MISLVNGNSLRIPLADQSVQCVVTSPPYWGLRDYGTATWIGGDVECSHVVGGQVNQSKDKDTSRSDVYSSGVRPDVDAGQCRKCGAIRQDAQLGLEPTPEEYVANMVAVFREVWRVLRDDGTLWLNLGDSYAASVKGGNNNGEGASTLTSGARPHVRAAYNDGRGRKQHKVDTGLKPKDLVGIPWRLAFALQADGWYLRSDTIESVQLYCPCGCGYQLEERIWRYSQDRDIIWSKPNPMPESVTDRPTKAHEYVFLLTKQARYYYDAEAVREDGSGRVPGNKTPTERRNNGGIEHGAEGHGFFESQQYPAIFRNRRTVWTIATQPYSGAHFATFPEALVEPCVKAGTSERGCCPVCGKGWRRVVEKEKPPTADTRTPGRHTPTGNGKMSGAKTQEWINEHPPTTLGWLPACEHDAAPIPCTVFDPFAGSGTVGVVAQKLGRSFAGLELSLDYIGLAQERIAKANGYHVGRLI